MINIEIVFMIGQSVTGDTLVKHEHDGDGDQLLCFGVRFHSHARADEISTEPSSLTRDECYRICLRHLKTGELEQTADSSDYRDVDGVKVPFKISLTNAMQSVTMTFTKVENNVAIDDKVFVKP